MKGKWVKSKPNSTWIKTYTLLKFSSLKINLMRFDFGIHFIVKWWTAIVWFSQIPGFTLTSSNSTTERDGWTWLRADNHHPSHVSLSFSQLANVTGQFLAIFSLCLFAPPTHFLYCCILVVLLCLCYYSVIWTRYKPSQQLSVSRVCFAVFSSLLISMSFQFKVETLNGSILAYAA